MKNYTINKVQSADCYFIRKSILRPHQTAELVCFEQDNHAKSFHLGLFVESILIGVVSMLYDGENVFRLRGMAILKDSQKKGYGKVLIQNAIDHTATQTLLWCNARTHVLAFYQSFGFIECGETFEVEHTGPHIRMQLKL